MKNHETLAQQEYIAKQIRRRQMVAAARILLLVSILALWEISARMGIINDFIFSSPSRMAACFLSMVEDRSIFYHTGITVLETIISFVLVIGIGIAGAVLLWSSKSVSEILDPYLVMLNSLPKSALAPILIVWLGANMRTIVAAAISVAVFGSILTLHNGFMSMDQDQVKLIYSLGGNRSDVLFQVLLPGSIPLIVSNMKVNVGLCLVGVIIGEFLAARAGLGYLIIYGSQVLSCEHILTGLRIVADLKPDWVSICIGPHILKQKTGASFMGNREEETNRTKEVEIYDKISRYLTEERLLAPDERIRFLELLVKEFRA